MGYKYHMNPLTGVVNSCGEDRCFHNDYLHFDSKSERELFYFNTYKEKSPINFHDENFWAALRELTYYGFTSKNILNSHINLLITDTVIKHYASLLRNSSNGELQKVFTWILKARSKRTGENFNEIYEKVIGALMDKSAFQMLYQSEVYVPIKTIISYSVDLWLYLNSPFHNEAKYALMENSLHYKNISYQKKVPDRINVFDTKNLCENFNVDYRDLPEGVVAYDIEADTTYAFGLRPLMTELTDVVFATKHKIYTVSGDETFILSQVENFFNLFKDHRFVGWNNHCYDDIFLESRAEVRRLKWRGRLTETVNHSPFEPNGPLYAPCRLNFNLDEQTIETNDLFQVLNNHSRWFTGDYFFKGLKSFAEELGCRPFRLDGGNLHRFTNADRSHYVVSDGLMTLRAAKELSTFC